MEHIQTFSESFLRALLVGWTAFFYFIDLLPFSLIPLGAGVGLVVAGYWVFYLRLRRVWGVATGIFKRTGSKTIEEEVFELIAFATYCAQVIGLGMITPGLFVATFWPLMEGNRALLTGEELNWNWAKYFSDFLESTRCGIWHALKGVPDSAIGWLNRLLDIHVEKAERLLSYTCGPWYDWYSAIIGFLVLPLFLLCAWVGGSVVWKRRIGRH